MKTIRIDPWEEAIYEFELVDDGLDALYSSLTRPDFPHKCSDINSVMLSSNRDLVLWVDGEGLLFPDLPVFHLADYPSPLAGIGLVTGIDDEGNTVGFDYAYPVYTPIIEKIRRAVRWTNKLTTGKLGPTVSSPGLIKIGDAILKEKS